jgi:hypothetical protein
VLHRGGRLRVAHPVVDGLRAIVVRKMVLSALARAVPDNACIRWEVVSIWCTRRYGHEGRRSSFGKEREVSRVIAFLQDRLLISAALLFLRLPALQSHLASRTLLLCA